MKAASNYEGRRVFIIGKRNSGFELASGMLPWANSITLASPSPTKLSVVTKSLVGVRARYLQPFEDNSIGGGCGIADVAIEGILPSGGGLQVSLRRTSDAEIIHVTADDVVNATGFITPLNDLPALGVATFGQSRLPAQTDYWESASVPGIFFAGTITQGAPSLGKYGIPPNSEAVHGHRYNAVILARYIAENIFAKSVPTPEVGTDSITSLLLDEIDHSPVLWHQRGYLSRCFVRGPGDGLRDLGYVPLTVFVDRPGDDGVALTMEADGSGAICPVIYVRRNSTISEHQLPPVDPIGSSSAEQSRAVESALNTLRS